MKKAPQKTNKFLNQEGFIFQKKNYIVMFIGILVIALGFILMSGGGSDDPNVYTGDMFSFTRIRIVPTLVIIGFAIEIYAILLNPEKKKNK